MPSLPSNSKKVVWKGVHFVLFERIYSRKEMLKSFPGYFFGAFRCILRDCVFFFLFLSVDGIWTNDFKSFQGLARNGWIHLFTYKDS